MPATDLAIELRRVRKSYSGLRPLRIESLAVHAGEVVTLSGLDALAGEVAVNLITGATLPDEGEIQVFGEPTRAIAGGDDWLSWLTRFGIVTNRGVLLDLFSVRQNLALPITLEVEPVPPDVVARVERLADEVKLPRRALDQRAADTGPDIRIRVHLARALALDPIVCSWSTRARSSTARRPAGSRRICRSSPRRDP